MRALILLLAMAVLAPADGVDERIVDTAVAVLQDGVEKDELRGAVVLAAVDGDIVLHEAIGWRDKEAGLPMEKDTLFHLASNTKPVIAAAILMLAEDDKLSLDDPVRRYLPSFDNYKAGRITIRRLLTHTGGLLISTLFVQPLLDDTSLQKEAARYGPIGAEMEPGTSYSYSNPGYNTLAAIIEIVSGQPLKTFLRERIYEPLGMSDSYNHEPDAPAARMGMVYKRKEGKWSVFQKPDGKPRFPFPRGSGGMISTAADYFRFCQMYLDGGALDGKRVLSEESVKAATDPHTRSVYSPEEQWKRDVYYGFGWSVSRSGAYHHGGSEGTYAWVDPARKLVGLYFTQSPSNQHRRKFRALVEAAIDAEE